MLNKLLFATSLTVKRGAPRFYVIQPVSCFSTAKTYSFKKPIGDQPKYWKKD